MFDDLEEFCIAVSENREIQDEILNMKNEYLSKEMPNKVVSFIKDKILPLAKQYGYNFTIEDYFKMKEEKVSKNLNLRNLLKISGGRISVKTFVVFSGFNLLSL
ncbi:MAG: Nif11-like leader peptide family natural product precursor [Oscillospiraceae bacterium]|jgi:hypothetical protein|nr:Nif11-like leader peptide family natural product precursor [Oscillospiraceae bacterium]